jgi:hypothetical protein
MSSHPARVVTAVRPYENLDIEELEKKKDAVIINKLKRTTKKINCHEAEIEELREMVATLAKYEVCTDPLLSY